MIDLWSESQCMKAVVLDPGPCSVMGETSNSISDSGQRVRHFQKGVDGLRCVLIFYHRPSDVGLPLEFRAIAPRTSECGKYSTPADVPESQFRRLRRHAFWLAFNHDADKTNLLIRPALPPSAQTLFAQQLKDEVIATDFLLGRHIGFDQLFRPLVMRRLKLPCTAWLRLLPYPGKSHSLASICRQSV